VKSHLKKKKGQKKRGVGHYNVPSRGRGEGEKKKSNLESAINRKGQTLGRGGGVSGVRSLREWGEKRKISPTRRIIENLYKGEGEPKQ